MTYCRTVVLSTAIYGGPDKNIEAGTNSETLLQVVVRAIIELCEAAHLITVPLTDYSDEGDSEAEKEGEEEGEEAAVVKGRENEVVVRGGDEVVAGKKEVAVVKGEEEAAVMEEGEEMKEEEEAVLAASLNLSCLSCLNCLTHSGDVEVRISPQFCTHC